ncbi:MAG: FAD-binding oxidoreductase [Thermodesulfobacteriota bacterium]
MRIANWGLYPVVDATVRSFTAQADAQRLLATMPPAIPRGLGRSYGDSSLAPVIVDVSRFRRLSAFDPATGLLTCEAGVSLAEILTAFVPRGWFLPVTPGTRFVTVGGAIASDVHGKNHHRAGTFSQHVTELTVLLADGRVVRTSRSASPDLFAACCGGMGLCGLILTATLRLVPIESAAIRQTTVRAKDLAETMACFEETAAATYSVAWIDCLAQGSRLGRSVLFLGEHAAAGEAARLGWPHPLRPPAKRLLTVPCHLPAGLLNRLTVRAFNEVYYRRQPAGASQQLVDLMTFFYPLDAVGHWNRIYGRRGFCQYQLVLPKEAGAQGLKAVLAAVNRQGRGSFLAVLKLFGPANGLPLSFPREGYTLALDFPMSPGLLAFLEDLDRIVLEHGGRLYLTKDARMSAAFFRASYPGAEAFIAAKRRFDPDNRFRSLQSQRLAIA